MGSVEGVEDPDHPYWSGFTNTELRALMTSKDSAPATRKLVATVYLRRKGAKITELGGTNERDARELP